ncbi:hypothetical protein BC830DRAFT_1133952 [Chytriomyces sp. MP71]|nr:hypothetical protein BC830DRAFT_1133952 [Chytriomyces sp. MP71]
MRFPIALFVLIASVQATFLLPCLAALGLAAGITSKLLGGVTGSGITRPQQNIVNQQQVVVNQPPVVINQAPPVVVNQQQPSIIINQQQPPVVINQPVQQPVIINNQRLTPQAPIFINNPTSASIVSSLPTNTINQISIQVNLPSQITIQIIQLVANINIQQPISITVIVQTIANQVTSSTGVTVQSSQIVTLSQIIVQSGIIASNSEIFIIFQQVASVSISGSGVFTTANGQRISTTGEISGSTPLFTPGNQISPFMPAFNTYMGFPGMTNGGLVHSVLTSPSATSHYGSYMRAANLNETDGHIQAILIMADIATRNGTLSVDAADKVMTEVNDVAQAYDVPASLVTRLAAGVVDTYEANNVSKGSMYEAFVAVAHAASTTPQEEKNAVPIKTIEFNVVMGSGASFVAASVFASFFSLLL